MHYSVYRSSSTNIKQGRISRNRVDPLGRCIAAQTDLINNVHSSHALTNNTHAYTHIIRKHTLIHKHTHSPAQQHKITRTATHTHTQTHALTSTATHTHTQTHAHTSKVTHPHTQTELHINLSLSLSLSLTHTHTHTSLNRSPSSFTPLSS